MRFFFVINQKEERKVFVFYLLSLVSAHFRGRDDYFIEKKKELFGYSVFVLLSFFTEVEIAVAYRTVNVNKRRKKENNQF